MFIVNRSRKCINNKCRYSKSKKYNCADTKYDIKITDISGDNNIVDVTQTGGGNDYIDDGTQQPSGGNDYIDGGTTTPSGSNNYGRRPSIAGIPAILNDPDSKAHVTDTGSGNKITVHHTVNNDKEEKPIWLKYWWVILLIVFVSVYAFYPTSPEYQQYNPQTKPQYNQQYNPQNGYQ